MVYSVPIVRSTISEFSLKKKIIVPTGPSAINLVTKTLQLQDKVKPNPSRAKASFRFRSLKTENEHLIYLPYDPEQTDLKMLEQPSLLSELNNEIDSMILSLKAHVLKA
jgi:hypothetical protein